MAKFDAAELAKWQRKLGPQAVKDLDAFLDDLPKRAGNTPLIASGIIWLMAVMSVLFAYTKTQEVFEIHREITEAEALRPSVPSIIYTQIREAQLKEVVENAKKIYPNVNISLDRSGDIAISANTTGVFSDWRAAIDHFSYVRQGWRIKIKSFCAGRECDQSPLNVVLQLHQIDIKVPNTG